MPALIDIVPEVKQKGGYQRLLKPKTSAIALLPETPAIYYNYIHTAQVGLYYYLRSRHLIDNPLATLLQDIPPLAVSQFLYCTICLPRAGHWQSLDAATETVQSVNTGAEKKKGVTGIVGASKRRPGQVKRGPTEQSSSLPSRIISATVALMLTLLVPPTPLFIIALCLGAPLYPTSSLPHTLALAVHVSLLTFMPIFYAHGVARQAWKEVIAAWLPFDTAGVWGGSVGCFVGGWIGAVPIALDWDRDWQEWPCTVVWGAVLGWAVGRVLTSHLGLGVGKRIDMSVPEIEERMKKVD